MKRNVFALIKDKFANINGLYARDDEEDETFAKSYLQRFFTDFYRIPVGDSRELLKLCWKDFGKYFYNRTDDDFFSLFLGAVLNNSNYTIREKKMILNLSFQPAENRRRHFLSETKREESST